MMTAGGAWPGLLPAAVETDTLVFPTGIQQVLLFFLAEGKVVCANDFIGVVEPVLDRFRIVGGVEGHALIASSRSFSASSMV